MATYYFEQFKSKICDPEISISQINDSINEKQCSVYVFLNTEKAEFGIMLHGFEYSNDWTDQQVFEWTINELKKYKID